MNLIVLAVNDLSYFIDMQIFHDHLSAKLLLLLDVIPVVLGFDAHEPVYPRVFTQTSF